MLQSDWLTKLAQGSELVTGWGEPIITFELRMEQKAALAGLTFKIEINKKDKGMNGIS